MLLNVHVKNIALIDEADISFDEGLNILTGETGAGKSVLISAVNTALGAKVSKGMIREGCSQAEAQLLFAVTEDADRAALESIGVYPDDEGLLLISRTMTEKRSICRINDSIVTASRLREASSVLIDVLGQHENQTLQKNSSQLEILDCFAKDPSSKEAMRVAYRAYADAVSEMSLYDIDERERRRETDLLTYEVSELESADIKEGEIAQLEARHRLLSNAGRILESIGRASELISGNEGASELFARGQRHISDAAELDPGLAEILSQADEAADLVDDLGKALDGYIRSLEFDQDELSQTEKRLDLLRGLQVKYGNSFEEIRDALVTRRRRLEDLAAFDEKKEQARADLQKAEAQAREAADALSQERKRNAKTLEKKISLALAELDFADVRFEIRFYELDHMTANGYDGIGFFISLNPGEPLKPLADVASGGELSRIMLAVKSVLADADQIQTLIFDEVDAGISGRTAQRVSEKLCDIAKAHQVICITHLPQIAAMADAHFKIEKTVRNERTITGVTRLDGHEQVCELARLLGGAKITDAVMGNAKEMKELAQKYKQGAE